MTQPTMIAADHIRQLTHPYSTTEWVTQPTQNPDGKWRTTTRLHTVHHKALLNQLKDAATGATSKADENAGRTTYGSKPTAHLEALDVYDRINTQSRELATQLHIPPMPLEARLLAISGNIGDKPHHRVKTWWIAARIATQWETRPYQPTNAPCPIETCEQFGTLRVRYEEHLAHCTHCGTTWEGEAEVQNLGRHVKWSTDHDLNKPRHWTLTPEGDLVECVECLATRDAMTQRTLLRVLLDRQAHPAAC